MSTLIAGKAIHPRPCTHHADLLRKVAGLCNNYEAIQPAIRASIKRKRGLPMKKNTHDSEETA